MRVSAYLPTQNIRVRQVVQSAANLAGMEFTKHTEVQDAGSSLYRDPDAIGILWAPGLAAALKTVKGWRLGNIDNLVVAMLGKSSLHHSSSALLLHAGADDVQGDDIDARELAARLQALARRERENVDTFQRMHAPCVHRRPRIHPGQR